jgi:hypothetical protein
MSLSRRLTPIAILLPLVLVSLVSLASLGAAPTPGMAKRASQPPLTVHEWGTFTSIAGPDGRAVEWSPLTGPDDLPCFVERFQFGLKGTLPGKVRMETPVLYFYAPEDLTVNVNVRFLKGAITEWYPRAAVTPSTVTGSTFERPTFVSTAAWTDVKVTPGAVATEFPAEKGASHYYVARETDGAPVQIGTQREKFLFYRGIGNFEPPIAATLAPDGTLGVEASAGEPLGDLIWFENRGGKMTYQVQQIGEGESTLAPPVLSDASTPPTAELEQILIAQGLYPREAEAMVKTWRDSWFEEGARLFYIAPRKTIDATLPLEIAPAPAEITRVFVGRIELVTARTESDVRRAIDAKDTVALTRYGRFLRPIADRILAPLFQAERSVPAQQRRLSPELSAAMAALQPVYDAQWKSGHPPCAAHPVQENRLTRAR